MPVESITDLKAAASVIRDYADFIIRSPVVPSVAGMMHFEEVARECTSFAINNASRIEDRPDYDALFKEMETALADAGMIALPDYIRAREEVESNVVKLFGGRR